MLGPLGDRWVSSNSHFSHKCVAFVNRFIMPIRGFCSVGARFLALTWRRHGFSRPLKLTTFSQTSLGQHLRSRGPCSRHAATRQAGHHRVNSG